MYKKLTKKELINMLISSNEVIESFTQTNKDNYDVEMPSYVEVDKVPYHTICSCNPANGGSGICGCVMANEMVDRIGLKGNIKTNYDT